MNRIAVAVCILVLCISFVGTHTFHIITLSNDVEHLCEEVERFLQKGDWNKVLDELKETKERWEKSRFWACLTIDTNEIEEIEISLAQAVKYAEEQEKIDFLGEFTFFRMQLGHIPHQEGFSIEELL